MVSPILALLDRQTTRGSIALLAPGRGAVTYVALRDAACHVGDALRETGCGADSRVAVVLPNGPEAAAAMVSAMAVATCLPLNPGLRPDELRFALVDARADALVVPVGGAPEAMAVAQEIGLAVLEVPVMPSTGDPELGVDVPVDACWRPVKPRRRSPEPRPGGIALLLHTSGTTGRPKLVPLTPANLVAGACATAVHVGLGPADVGLGLMPLFHTHGLVGSLLSSLWAGAAVVCTPGFDERRIADWIARFRPTWYTASPALHQAFVTVGERYRDRAADHRFRFVRSTSSALAPATRIALEALTGAPVVEAYALTEAPGQVAATGLPPQDGQGGSVGRATGARIEVVDERGQLLPAGESGEIVVSGEGVICGYEVEGRILAFSDGRLHTGDIGSIDTRGDLRVLGRAKEIVDRGGEKISPREVDDRLLEHPDVAEAASFGVWHPRLGEDLIAAVVARPGRALKAAVLHSFLGGRLADAKRPSRILVVPSIPKGPTGKVRRAALPEAFSALLERSFCEPTNETERELVDIWRKALGCDQVGIDDDFFSLGGDSLTAVSLLVAIEQRFGRQYRLATLFESPTVRELARRVAGDAAPRASTVVPVQPLGDRPPLFFMSGWGSQLMVFTPLARELGRDQPLYGLDPTGLELSPENAASVEQVAAQMVKDIRAVRAKGPYHLAGFSLGGRYVWEIARRLRAEGEIVGMVALLDCNGPGFPGRPPFATRMLRHLRYAAQLPLRDGFAHLVQCGRDIVGRVRPQHRTLFADESLQASRLAQAMQRTSVALMNASANYVPAEYPGPMLLVRATVQPVQPALDVSDQTMGWGSVARGGVVVRPLACTHPAMLDPPYAPALASVLAEAMSSPSFASVVEFATIVGSVA